MTNESLTDAWSRRVCLGTPRICDVFDVTSVGQCWPHERNTLRRSRTIGQQTIANQTITLNLRTEELLHIGNLSEKRPLTPATLPTCCAVSCLCLAPYVKVYVMEGKRCIGKKKTRTARRTLEPLYQQMLDFKVDYIGKTLQVSGATGRDTSYLISDIIGTLYWVTYNPGQMYGTFCPLCRIPAIFVPPPSPLSLSPSPLSLPPLPSLLYNVG